MLFLGVIRYEQYFGELVAYGDFSPFGAYGTTFPPLCGGTTTRALLCATYEIVVLRSFIVPPLAGERWWRQPPKGGSFSHGRSPVVKVLFILAPQAPTTTLAA